jgi:endonuclease IV
VSKWDEKPLVELFKVSCKRAVLAPSHYYFWSAQLELNNVGSHIDKTYAINILKSKANVVEPFQIFLYSNQPCEKTEKQCRETLLAMKLDFSPYKAFVHAPYNLNFAKDDHYVFSSSKMYLEDSAQLGFRGVVFHCGHYSDFDTGNEKMRMLVNKLLPYISPKCPLLLETPCGAKNELLPSPQDFGNFISSFPQDKIGICLDTCHVHVSGYDIPEYLAVLESLDLSTRIRLIHFNGSRKLKGTKIDGHQAVISVQEIPNEDLLLTLDFARNYNIPCINE